MKVGLVTSIACNNNNNNNNKHSCNREVGLLKKGQQYRQLPYILKKIINIAHSFKNQNTKPDVKCSSKTHLLAMCCQPYKSLPCHIAYPTIIITITITSTFDEGCLGNQKKRGIPQSNQIKNFTKMHCIFTRVAPASNYIYSNTF